jgi:hypothetical protein
MKTYVKSCCNQVNVGCVSHRSASRRASRTASVGSNASRRKESFIASSTPLFERVRVPVHPGCQIPFVFKVGSECVNDFVLRSNSTASHQINTPPEVNRLIMSIWDQMFQTVTVAKDANGNLCRVTRASGRCGRRKGSTTTRTSKSHRKSSFTVDSQGNARLVASDHLTAKSTSTERSTLSSR